MLTFNTTKINFGDIKYGERPSYTIEVSNNSDREIVLVSQTSCSSCTKANTSPNPIKAGTKSNLNIALDTTRSGEGDITKTVRLNWFHNGTTYNEIITIKANVSRS